MDFTWDENKRRTRRDDRKDYGEERQISLGMVDDECFVVVIPSGMVQLG